MMYRCRERPNKAMFSLKTGTVMEGSNLNYRVWAIAMHFRQGFLPQIHDTPSTLHEL